MLIHCPDKYIKQERNWRKDENKRGETVIIRGEINQIYVKQTNKQKKRKLNNVRKVIKYVKKESRHKTSLGGGKRASREVFQETLSCFPPHPLLPLSAKLFRATSAARLIKFSFLQITIRKRGALLNHKTTTRYTAVYLCWEGDEQRGTKAAEMIALYLNHFFVLLGSLCILNLFVNTLNSPSFLHAGKQQKINM